MLLYAPIGNILVQRAGLRFIWNHLFGLCSFLHLEITFPRKVMQQWGPIRATVHQLCTTCCTNCVPLASSLPQLWYWIQPLTLFTPLACWGTEAPRSKSTCLCRVAKATAEDRAETCHHVYPTAEPCGSNLCAPLFPHSAASNEEDIRAGHSTRYLGRGGKESWAEAPTGLCVNYCPLPTPTTSAPCWEKTPPHHHRKHGLGSQTGTLQRK